MISLPGVVVLVCIHILNCSALRCPTAVLSTVGMKRDETKKSVKRTCAATVKWRRCTGAKLVPRSLNRVQPPCGIRNLPFLSGEFEELPVHFSFFELKKPFR